MFLVYFVWIIYYKIVFLFCEKYFYSIYSVQYRDTYKSGFSFIFFFFYICCIVIY